MNYMKITKCDIANGPGCRVTLWVSGCEHHCFNCHNPETWPTTAGKPFTKQTMDTLIALTAPYYIAGLTFSGGDPLHPANRETVMKIAARFKQVYPEKNIWLWTGYMWNEVKDITGIENIDVLVDGEFFYPLRDLSLQWRGSANQEVIDVTRSLESNRIISYKEKQ